MLKNFKVLLLYPSLYMQTGIPLAIACLSGALKAHGVTVRVFDTHPYRFGTEVAEHEFRSTVQHSTRAVNYGDKGIYASDEDPFDALTRLLDEFRPDLVGMSAAESVFERGCQLTRHVKAWNPKIPVIAGGVFPTLAPEIAFREASLDMICIGEGESALVEVCQRVASGQSHADVAGIWARDGDAVVKNARRLEDLATLARPDFHIFDKGTFLRPMQGHLFRTIPMEFSRGCPYPCTFCAEPALEKAFADVGHKFFRKKEMSQIIDELRSYVDEYDPDFFYFSSETFLAISNREFDEFIESYADINLPFWIQTRPETLTADKIRRLKDVGLFWMSIGVEHGDEDFRTRVLKRTTPDDMLLNVARILREVDQGVSLNFIIGFPFETRELVHQTLRFSRELYKTNPLCRCNIFGFTPFRGSELYDAAVRNGFWDPSIPFVTETDVTASAMIDNPNMSPDVVKGLMRAYPLYVYLPEEHLHRVAAVETFSPPADAEYEALNAIVTKSLSSGALPLPPRKPRPSPAAQPVGVACQKA